MLDEFEARQRILDKVSPAPVIWVPLELSQGQVLAQAINGIIDSPVFDNSSMDGYAVRAEETQTGSLLKVAELEQAAGPDFQLVLEPGEAIRIFTGAAIPEGANAVIMQEDVERTDGVIKITEGVEKSENIRRRGGDVCAGQLLLSRGELMTPTRIGLIASQGISEIPVHCRPMVNVITTGDELVDPGAPLIPGEIYNSNGPMLKAAAEHAGAIASTDHALDDVDMLGLTLENAISTGDIVIIAGGVSVGERDYVKQVLQSLGVITDFWRVNVKPGKPFLFGQHPDGTLVFGLPGNPVSAYVTFNIFALPAIRKALGVSVVSSEAGQGTISGVAQEEMKNTGDRPHYLRGKSENGAIALSGTQQSHAVFGLSKANCLIRLEPGQVISKGEPVSAFVI